MEKVTVLFVDDEADFRTLSIRQIKRIIKDISFEFYEAGNGEEALALLKGGLKPSIIILDYAMPKIDGMELLLRIDRENPELSDIPRIMISGYIQEDLVKEAEKLNCAFFEKRIDNRTFYQQVCEYMIKRLDFSHT